MKLAILVLVFVAWSNAVAVAEPSAKLEVTARIAEVPNGYGICGRMAIFAVLRYEVITVDQGTYDDKDLFVIVLCPESYKVGMKHRLTLERSTWKKGRYFDRLGGTAPRYRATKIARI